MILCLILFLATIYNEDYYKVRKAVAVRVYLVNFCIQNARYPKIDEFDKRFPKMAKDRIWSYRPADDLKSGTFEYMMTLPLPSAPGTLKLFEYIPLVDSYVITNPCQSFSK